MIPELNTWALLARALPAVSWCQGRESPRESVPAASLSFSAESPRSHCCPESLPQPGQSAPSDFPGFLQKPTEHDGTSPLSLHPPIAFSKPHLPLRISHFSVPRGGDSCPPDRSLGWLEGKSGTCSPVWTPQTSACGSTTLPLKVCLLGPKAKNILWESLPIRDWTKGNY